MSVLDVGCGSGEWVYLLRRCGLTAIGVEPDPGYSEFGREEYGILIENRTVDDLMIPSESFDAVSTFHSLEHMVDPVDALIAMARVLKPGGTVLIEVPNAAAPSQHPTQRFHRAHPISFTRESLLNAILMAGLTPIRIDVDRYDRNIRMSARKRSEADARDADARACRFVKASMAAPADFRALVRYYGDVSTYRRALERIAGNIHGRAATYRTRSPRDIVDRVFAEIS